VNIFMLPLSVFEADTLLGSPSQFSSREPMGSSTLSREIYPARRLKSGNVWEWSEISAVRPVSFFPILRASFNWAALMVWDRRIYCSVSIVCENCANADWPTTTGPWTVSIVKPDKRLLFYQSVRAWMELGEGGRVAGRRAKTYLHHCDR